MKFSLKELLKLLAPYLVAIGGVVGVYADGKTEIAMLDYRVEQVAVDTISAGGALGVLFVLGGKS